MKKILVGCFALLLSLSIFTPITSAGSLHLPHEILALEKSFVAFTSDKTSEIKLDSVKVLRISENENRIRVEQTRQANGIPEAYRVTLNLEEQTYTATRVEPSVSTTKLNTTNNQLISPTAINNYYAYVTAKTLDPVNVLCNSTTLGWGWSENTSTTSYPFSYNWRSLNTFAANPTSLGTNWYLATSRYGNDPGGSGQSASSSFVNYNFGGGIFGDTWADHYINIGPKAGGNYHYYAELTTDGIAGNLLHLEVEST